MATINLYDITIPQLIHTLECLNNILTKAMETAPSKNLSLDDLATARLAPDMFPLTKQISIASDVAKFVAVRVAGVPNVEMADDEETFDDMKARVAKTVDFLRTVKREDFEGAEAKQVALREYKFTALDYVMQFALPNFFFHVTAAYSILRMKGIDVGKMDYLGNMSKK